VIQHSMISKSIERAQKKVEENNFGIRKRLLEYDDVMNSQREVIYKRRRHALFGDRLEVDIMNNMYDAVEELVQDYHGGSYDDFKLEILRLASMEPSMSEEDFNSVKASEVSEKVFREMLGSYTRKIENIAKQAYPVIKNVYETRSHQYKNIVVPFTDGKRNYQVVTNLEKAYKNKGKEVAKSFEKQIILRTIDDSWKEQLREMDDLRTSVQNATYEQKDPLLIYKLESFGLFKQMINNVNRKIVSILAKGHIPISDPSEVREAEERRRTDMSRMQTGRAGLESGQQGAPNQAPQKTQPVRIEKKVGRNDPCPCGSGKKFKNCHGAGLPS
ncbi:MAG TPA: SEC-C metal-binding domain-containing protein, partial [Prolixibacteraceae bacterium]|nr:SEC-C metal-binding domain-containing protein [Prolixibacteraceae bacterium]